MTKYNFLFRRNLTDASEYNNTLYIPLYIDWNNLDEIKFLPLFTFLLELEVVVLSLNGAVNGILAFNVFNTQTIHSNLKWIYFCHLMEYYAFFGAQFILMCYQVGWIWVGYDSNGDNNDYLLVICGLIKLQRLWSCFAIVFAVIIERTWATCAIRHYEKSNKFLFSFLVVISKLCFTVYMAINTLRMRLSFIICFAIAYIVIICSFMWISVLMWCNMRMLKNLEKIRSCRYYALSKRYQLKENARVLKITRIFFFIVSCNVSILLLLATVMQFFVFGNAIAPYFVLFIEFLIASTPVFFIILLKLLPPSYLNVTEKPQYLRPSSKRVRDDTDKNEEESSIYFSQLKQMWS